MNLGDARNRLVAAVRRMGKSYGPEELDFALQAALNQADLSSYHSLTLTSKLSMVQNVVEIDVSSLTGLRPEKVLRAMLAVNDRNTWLTATVYAVNDLVQGDGTPDSYYWVCTEAHTSSASNEPGQGDNPYWERTLWKRGLNIEVTDLTSIAHMLGDRPSLWPFLPNDFVFSTVETVNAAGKPRYGAFLTQDIFLVYPPPLHAYKLQFLMRSAVTDWTPGTEADVELEIPDNVLMPMIFWGAAYYLDTTQKDADVRQANFKRHIELIDGNVAPQGAGIGYKDRRAYTDGTDGQLFNGFGYPRGNW